jgi:class 3 adenylate cyclase
MRTENLAIVFIDIAGYTQRTSSQTREENLAMLKRFDGLVRPIVRCYHGSVVKTIGDAYLLTFRSPTHALLCSMAIQDRIAETDKDVTPADRFIVRAAVNAGDVRLEGSDVFGEAVNIASRIEGKAGPGEIWFSESVYLSMTRSEVPSEEVGYAELKGIQGKVRLYRIPRKTDTGVLPFGGQALNRVRDRLSSSMPVPVEALAPAVETARELAQKGSEVALRGFTWWQFEVRRNKTVQYATIAVLIALIGLMVWAFWPKQQTPLQRLHRTFGF